MIGRDASRWRRRTPWGAVGLSLLVIGSWALRFVGAEHTAPLDLFLYFYPVYEATYGRIAGGTLPLWNPYQLCGIPWLATLQGGVFYPLHALYLWLPLHVGLAISHVLHLVGAALATAAFVRRAGLTSAAALLAAVLFTLRGMLAVSLASTNYLEATSWLPLGMLAVLELVRAPGPGWIAILGGATALSFLAGYPQPTVYILYLWATLLAALLVGTRAGAGQWLSRGGAFGAALGLGALAAAAQLAPALELVGVSGHRELAPEAMFPFGVSPARFILTLGAIGGEPFAEGVTALALGAVALLTRRHRTLAWWAITLCALTATFALGAQTPLFRFYLALPLLGGFRFPDRLIGMTDFAFAIAAAIGLDVVSGAEEGHGDAERSRAGRSRAVLAALAMVGVVFVLARRGYAPADRQAYVAWFVLAAGTILSVGLLWRRLSPTLLASALVLLAITEISLAPWTQRLAYSGDAVAQYRRHEVAYRAVRELAGPDRVWFYGGLANLQPALADKLTTRYRLHAIDDYEPLNLARQSDYFTFLTEGARQFRRPPWLFAGRPDRLAAPPGVAPLATRRRLLDLAALRFLIVPSGLPGVMPELDALIRDGGFEPRALAGEGLALFENPHALPRAYVVYRARPAPPPDELLATISRAEFDPLVATYVEGAVDLGPAADTAPRGEAARIVRDDERVVEIDAVLAAPGLVVLADSFYPGWRATVDGAPASIVAANHLFRGVRAPAGPHRIRFEYRPLSVALGVVGSAIGWVVIVVLACWEVAPRRPGRPLTAGAEPESPARR